jgi:S1-C subfamily serine protease
MTTLRVPRWCSASPLAACWAILLTLCIGARAAFAAEPIAVVLEQAQSRVVKITGAAVGTQKGYASGVLVSADGRIVTAASPLLEASAVRVVLHDGRDYEAKVLRRDEVRQLALLKIEASATPHFTLEPVPDPPIGTRLFAAANPFKVAEGPEPVSVTTGVFAGRARLAARNRAQQVGYRGEVLLTDMITSAPGMAGGALFDADGRLLGVLGRPLISDRTNTWLNYAMPAAEVAAFVASNGGEEASGESAGAPAADPNRVLMEIGVRLFDVGGRSRPAYVERVRPGSPAAAAGLLADDLILSVEDEPVATCAEVRQVVADVRGAERLRLSVKRADAVHAFSIPIEPRVWEPPAQEPQ